MSAERAGPFRDSEPARDRPRRSWQCSCDVNPAGYSAPERDCAVHGERPDVRDRSE